MLGCGGSVIRNVGPDRLQLWARFFTLSSQDVAVLLLRRSSNSPDYALLSLAPARNRESGLRARDVRGYRLVQTCLGVKAQNNSITSSCWRVHSSRSCWWSCVQQRTGRMRMGMTARWAAKMDKRRQRSIPCHDGKGQEYSRSILCDGSLLRLQQTRRHHHDTAQTLDCQG